MQVFVIDLMSSHFSRIRFVIRKGRQSELILFSIKRYKSVLLLHENHRMFAAEVFGDSAFVSDNDNYPTVEEQIKMARKVALSLISPINQDTRGHRMFMARKEKAENEDASDQVKSLTCGVDQADGGFYNPAKRASSGTWKPGDVGSDSYEPSSKRFWAASQIPTVVNENNINMMSAEEFERVQLFDQKSTHDTVAPQVCFSLANDLRNSNSKGGRMFAKRRDNADQWSVENQPKMDVMDKIKMNFAANSMRTDNAYISSQAANDNESKLNGEIPRARITPWEAAIEYGNVDPAFEHLIDASPQISKTG